MPRGQHIPIPKKVLRLRGETRAERLGDEPEPIDLLDAVPPDDLFGDVAREVWSFTVRQLQTMDLAYLPDRDALRAYCEAVSTHREASKSVHALGVVIPGRTGESVVRNPAVVVQTQAARSILNFSQEFGLTPAGRARLRERGAKKVESVEDNPFAATG